MSKNIAVPQLSVPAVGTSEFKNIILELIADVKRLQTDLASRVTQEQQTCAPLQTVLASRMAQEQKVTTAPLSEADAKKLEAVKFRLMRTDLTDLFCLEIGCMDKNLLAHIDIDMSWYVNSDSMIFDIIAQADYDLAKLNDAEYAICWLIEHGFHLPDHVRWPVIIRRIETLAKCDHLPIVNWNVVIEKFNYSQLEHSSKIKKSDCDTTWCRMADKLRDTMMEAAIRDEKRKGKK